MEACRAEKPKWLDVSEAWCNRVKLGAGDVSDGPYVEVAVAEGQALDERRLARACTCRHPPRTGPSNVKLAQLNR